LPKALADLVRMVQIVIEQLGMGGERSTGGLKGVGIGAGSFVDGRVAQTRRSKPSTT
jgi:hypothetical protein